MKYTIRETLLLCLLAFTAAVFLFVLAPFIA